jgi:tetratricopeptide (TPR) repeat protein
MITPINTIAKLQALRASTSISSVILILAIAVAANAQGVGSSRGLSSGDGNHSIQGRIYFPAGQPVNSKVVKISLESTNSGGTSTMSDEDGTFRFNGLRPGSYSVVVDAGKQYDAAREPVTIDQTGAAPVIQVNIQLRPRIDASNPSFAGVPREALDFYQKGTAAAQKGNPKSAVEFLGKAVSTYPNFTLALSDLGVQYMKLGQMDKAAETLEALLKLKPDDATAHLDLGIALYNLSTALYSEKKLDESAEKAGQAESHLREALKLNSPGPSAHYYLGLTLIKLKRYGEAQSEMESAISNGGENLALAHRYLGGLYQVARKNQEAANEFEKFLKLDPKAKDADTIKEMIEKLRKQ